FTPPGLLPQASGSPETPLSSRDVPDLRTIVMSLTICTPRQHIDCRCPPCRPAPT
ncbi:hypothetical protein C8R44DRAFT_762380, partial [Mycena epipterygia]